MIPGMADYRIYRLEGVGRIAPAEFIKAPDDDDAIRQARKLSRNALKCEVWEQRRLVITLDNQQLRE